jgi:hypothetical protein
MPTFRELNLPEEILDKIKERCEQSGTILDLDETSMSGNKKVGFNWSNSIEGKEFWYNILYSSLTPNQRKEGIEAFFKKYPERYKPIELISEEPRTYKASYKGKKFEITIKEIKDEN